MKNSIMTGIYIKIHTQSNIHDRKNDMLTAIYRFTTLA